MDYNELKKIIEENPTLMDELKKDILKADELENILTTDEEGKRVRDKIVQTAINSFKEKGLQNILEKERETLRTKHFEEFAKENGIELDPRVKALEDKIREMELKTAESEKKERLHNTRATVTSELAKRKMNIDLADFLNQEDSEKAMQQLDKLSELFQNSVEDTVKEKLKEGKFVPKSDDGDTTLDDNPFSKKGFNLTKQSELFKSDPEKAKQLQELAKNES